LPFGLNIYTSDTTLKTWLPTMNDMRAVDMSRQAGGCIAVGNRFKAVEPIERRHPRGGNIGALREALEGQSSSAAQALHDRAIRPLAAVHLKLAGLADSLPVGERHRLLPLTSILAEFEAELRRLARMPATDLGVNQTD
jgi:hypothetical protein